MQQHGIKYVKRKYLLPLTQKNVEPAIVDAFSIGMLSARHFPWIKICRETKQTFGKAYKDEQTTKITLEWYQLVCQGRSQQWCQQQVLCKHHKCHLPIGLLGGRSQMWIPPRMHQTLHLKKRQKRNHRCIQWCSAALCNQMKRQHTSVRLDFALWWTTDVGQATAHHLSWISLCAFQPPVWANFQTYVTGCHEGRT